MVSEIVHSVVPSTSIDEPMNQATNSNSESGLGKESPSLINGYVQRNFFNKKGKRLEYFFFEQFCHAEFEYDETFKANVIFILNDANLCAIKMTLSFKFFIIFSLSVNKYFIKKVCSVQCTFWLKKTNHSNVCSAERICIIKY